MTLAVGQRSTLGLLAFGSHDYLAHEEPSGATIEDLVSDFHRVDLRYDHAWDAGRFRIGATLGYDSQGSNPAYLTNRSVALRLELEQDLAPWLRLRTGGEGRFEVYGFRLEAPAEPNQTVVPSSVYPPRTNLTPAAYLDLVAQLGSRIEVVPGARVTIFDSTARATSSEPRLQTTVAAVDPRVSMRVAATPSVALLSSFGVAHQYPTLSVGELPAVVGAGAGFPGQSSELQRVIQASQGLELTLPARVVATATVFLTRSTGLTDFTASCLQIRAAERAERRGPEAERSVLLPELCTRAWSCPRARAARHALGHAAAEPYAFVHALPLGARGGLRGARGRRRRRDRTQRFAQAPFERGAFGYESVARGDRRVVVTGLPSQHGRRVPVRRYKNHRDPAFYRVDVRLEKRWKLGSDRWLAFVLEGQNVTLEKEANTLGMDCRGELTPESYSTECKRGEVGPLTLPSVGLEAIF